MIELEDFNWQLFISTRRYLAMSIALVAAGASILALAMYPQIQGIQETRTKLSREQDRLDRLERKVLELEQIKTLPEFAQSEVVENSLPDHKPLLEFLTSINQASKDSKVGIREFEINPGEIVSPGTAVTSKAKAQAGNRYDTLKIEMTVVGTLSRVEEFLALIEQSTPLSTITEISLSRRTTAGEEQTGDNILTTAELAITTYFYTQSVKTTLESPLPKISQREHEIFEELSGYRTTTLEQQQEIIGGGVEDLFGIDPIEILQE